ncbi:MAG: M56 family metallopeptidase [Chitinophagaceae bacterium]|nr:M56 family metallopeptidase [Chitinophagaceae bacterium]
MAFLLAVYFLLLEREKMYRFNRLYLLFSLAFSILIPFVPYKVYTEVASVKHVEIVNEVSDHLPGAASVLPAEESSTEYLLLLLFCVYGLVAGFLLIRFAKNVFAIFLQTRKHPQVLYHGAKLVLTNASLSNFTFFNYIFLNSEDYHAQRIEKELLSHELAHARQLHSLDILLVEILFVVFWFNPLLILYKKAVQLNHEYLADEAVLSIYRNPKDYQNLLLSKVELFSMPLANSFNYLITKKRLTMMTKPFSRTTAACKQLATLPLAALAVFLFSTRVEAQIETAPQQVLKPAESKVEKNDSIVEVPRPSKKEQVMETAPAATATGKSNSVAPQTLMIEKHLAEIVEMPLVASAQDPEPVQIPTVEVMPDFPGGMKKFKEFIANNTVHNGNAGTVEATFYVEKDGSVVVPALPIGSDNKNARALMKAIEGSPAWRPAVQNGRPKKVGHVMTVSFSGDRDVVVGEVAIINEEMVVSFEKRETDGRLFIHGLILNREGQPIAGASIRNAEYKSLAVSMHSGRFVIASAEQKPLMISCIGYATKRVGL